MRKEIGEVVTELGNIIETRIHLLRAEGYEMLAVVLIATADGTLEMVTGSGDTVRMIGTLEVIKRQLLDVKVSELEEDGSKLKPVARG